MSTLLGGGLLMGLAPVHAWPLAWVALIPLWCLSHYPQQQRRQAFVYAALWGIAYHGTALSWITGLHPLMWMGVPWVGSVAIALFAWVFITLWGAAIGMTWLGLILAVSRWQPLTGTGRVLVGTALWCAVEWVWSQGPLYWTSLSYTQSPGNLAALHLGQLSGPMTVTAAIVAVNGLLAEAWYRWRLPLKSEPDESPWLAHVKRVTSQHWLSIGAQNQFRIAAALFLSLHLVGLALYSRPLADNPSEALTVGLIQGNIPTRQKLTSQGIETSRQVYLEGYERLAAAGADIVLTPEGAIPQVWNTFLQERNLLQRAVVKNGVPLVLGTFVHQDIARNQTALTQSLLTLSPTGQVVGRYNKVKLVPLGEYLPFEAVLGGIIGRLSPVSGSMVPGGFDQQLETPLGPMAAAICYEAAFAELYRQQVSRGGQAIFTASNNDPYPPRQMMQHHAQDVMRAVETDRWEVRVTNTGISGVVDPHGRSRWLSAPNQSLTHLAYIYRRQTRTLYVRWGDWLTPLLLLLAASLLLIGR
ncbi:MAG: apolipoprotein N-acyltransferase [Phormidesmis sp.]